jgi:hypothetical protein
MFDSLQSRFQGPRGGRRHGAHRNHGWSITSRNHAHSPSSRSSRLPFAAHLVGIVCILRSSIAKGFRSLRCLTRNDGVQSRALGPAINMVARNRT